MKRTCLAALIALLACSAARSTTVDIVPTTPGRTTCAAGAWRCNTSTDVRGWPEHCEADEAASTVTRWWPKHGLTSDGASVAPCRVRCTVDDGGPAHCAGDPDASTATDASADAEVSQ